MNRVTLIALAISAPILWYMLGNPPFDYVDRKIDRLLVSSPEIEAYAYKLYEGEARPLDIWLTGSDRFLRFYSVGSDDLVEPDYAEIYQVSKFQIYCRWDHTEEGLENDADPGIGLGDLAIIIGRRPLTPEFIIREYSFLERWASRLSVDKANPTSFPNIEFSDGYGGGGLLIDFACWTASAAIPVIPGDAIRPRRR